MRFLLGLFIVSLPVFGQEVNLRNDREGTSYYSSNSEQRSISKALRQVDPTQIVGAYDEVQRELEPSKLCSFDLHDSLIKRLKSLNPRFTEVEGAILYLRSQNEFDDSVTKLLLQVNDIKTTKVWTKSRDKLRIPSTQVLKSAFAILSKFESKLQNSCFDDAYKNLFGELVRLDKNLYSSHVEGIFYEAKRSNILSSSLYNSLEQARKNELESSSLTLKSYYKKIQSLRTQFPLRDPEEKSNFVTARADKQKKSYRQHLLENYTDLQIVIMANVIKKLRTRIESPRAEILIFDRSQQVETIPLEPMERFRLAIKLLRKEMSQLPLNTFFQGRSPSYMDLMTAAYEVGLIPASELEEVAGLEDIWNPKKTFWQKAGIWIKTFSSVATIAIPPPYGFIPALVVVVIEMTNGANNNNNNNNDPSVLF